MHPGFTQGGSQCPSFFTACPLGFANTYCSSFFQQRLRFFFTQSQGVKQWRKRGQEYQCCRLMYASLNWLWQLPPSSFVPLFSLFNCHVYFLQKPSNDKHYPHNSFTLSIFGKLQFLKVGTHGSCHNPASRNAQEFCALGYKVTNQLTRPNRFTLLCNRKCEPQTVVFW